MTRDVVTAAGLIAGVYATPARLRPAVGLAVAVGLSRLHGAGVERMSRDVLALVTDGRAQVTPRVDSLERRRDVHEDRLDELEARLVEVELGRFARAPAATSMKGPPVTARTTEAPE